MTNTELWAKEFRKGLYTMTAYMMGRGASQSEIDLATEGHLMILERLDAEIAAEQAEDSGDCHLRLVK